MSNTLLYLKNILSNRWTKSIAGRQDDVPYPGDDNVIRVGDKRKQSHRTTDYLVLSAGVETKEPKGLGYTHRGRNPTGTISCRSSVSRDRVFGTRDGNNDCEDYGGLTGEVERILDDVRKGHKEFSTIRAPEIQDNTALEETGSYRGDVEFDMRIIAEIISP